MTRKAGQTNARTVWRYALAVIFWLGLAMCVWVLAANWNASVLALQRVPLFAWLLLLALLGLFWFLSVNVWRAAVWIHGIPKPSLAEAASHLALLLLGKYLPGGVWGFIARHASMREQGMRAVMAGVYEQYLGVATLAIISILLYAGLEASNLAALLIPIVPLVTGVGWRALVHLGCVMHRWFPARFAMPGRAPAPTVSGVLEVGGMSLAMQLAQLAFVAAFAHWGFQLPWATALVIAAIYGVAIVVGILSILVPGGIGVREAMFLMLGGGYLDGADAIALLAALRLMFTVFDGLAGVTAFVAIRLARPHPR